MTTFEATVEQVGTQAREVNVGRLLLTALVALFWALGWLVGKAVLALAYAGVAIRTGYREARRPDRPVGGSG